MKPLNLREVERLLAERRDWVAEFAEGYAVERKYIPGYEQPPPLIHDPLPPAPLPEEGALTVKDVLLSELQRELNEMRREIALATPPLERRGGNRKGWARQVAPVDEGPEVSRVLVRPRNRAWGRYNENKDRLEWAYHELLTFDPANPEACRREVQSWYYQIPDCEGRASDAECPDCYRGEGLRLWQEPLDDSFHPGPTFDPDEYVVAEEPPASQAELDDTLEALREL